LLTPLQHPQATHQCQWPHYRGARNDAYRLAIERAFQTISDAAIEVCFPASMRRHQPSLFTPMNMGLSCGKGQTTPCWLNNKEYTGIADSLLEDQDIGHMAGFADGAPPSPLACGPC
jgi:hypothetical protein